MGVGGILGILVHVLVWAGFVLRLTGFCVYFYFILLAAYVGALFR